MSEHVTKTIELVQGQIRDLEQQLLEKKRMVNSLCGLAGLQMVYAGSDLDSAPQNQSIRHDQFYGKKLVTAAREALISRRHLGAATAQEIFELLRDGGFHFQTKNDDYAKRGLYQSLTKNSKVFHRLPNGRYGLLEWYPNTRTPATKSDEEAIDSDVEGVDEDSIATAAMAAEEPPAMAGTLKSKPR